MGIVPPTALPMPPADPRPRPADDLVAFCSLSEQKLSSRVSPAASGTVSPALDSEGLMTERTWPANALCLLRPDSKGNVLSYCSFRVFPTEAARP